MKRLYFNSKKVIVILLLAIALLIPKVSYAVTISDISGHKYEDSITNLVDKEIVKGFEDGTFRPDGVLDRESAGALIFRAFDLAPVYPIESLEPDKDGNVITKTMYSTETTTANLASVMLPASPDSMGTWSENSLNAVLEARLLDEIDITKNVTKMEFALAISKGILGANKDIDFLSVAKEKGILPEDITFNEEEISRGEATYLLDYATRDLEIIPVMSTSDIHGNVIAYKPSGSPVEVGGSYKAAFHFKNMKNNNPNTIIVDAGDSPYNTDIVNHSKGIASVELMNAQDYDATVLGNHDFDYSFENLLSLAKMADYAMFSANTYLADGSYPKEFKPYIIKEVNGIKVGIVGLTDHGSKATTHYENTKEIELYNHWEIGKEVVEKLQKEVDIIIMLAHLHSDNNKVPDNLSNIDLVIGGGNDTFGRPIVNGDTIIVNPGGVGAAINQFNLNLIDDEIVGYTFNQIYLSPNTPDDEEVKEIVEKYKKELDDSMGKVIGTSNVDVAWSSPLVRTKEHPLGNLIADALKEYGDADIGLMNGGGIRAGVSAGDVTIGDVFKILPFDNKITVLSVTGETVWDALENGVSGYPETNGKFPQVSGLKYTFDGAKPVGERLISVSMEDGTPIVLDKWYKLVCNDFMAGGGDGYSMLNVLNPEGQDGNYETNYKDLPGCKLEFRTNELYRNMLIDYIEQKGNIEPKLEDRITIINPLESSQKLN